MLTSLRHNLAGLFTFSGRTGRSAFWPYAALVILLALVAINLAGEIGLSGAFANSARLENVHRAAQAPDFKGFVSGVAIVALIALLLLAASVTRRLHDSDKRGWWAAVPAMLLADGLVLMFRLFDMTNLVQPSQTFLFLLFLNNLAYLASLAVLVVLLAGAGTPGPNRYGDPPG